MTTIRRITVSQIDGNDANSTETDEIRPFGETAFYLDTDGTNKLVLMMFNGTRTHRKSKVLSPGELFGSNADSGDGAGFDTIKLIPDADLKANGSDQYLIVDPTGPNHIHIRAGGTQDNSSTELYIGGENSYFKVGSGVNPQVQIRSNNNDWTFDTSGFIVFPDSSVQTTAYSTFTPVMTNVTQTGTNTFSKTSGSGTAWDAQVYSKEGYTRGCYASASSNPNSLLMFGLNSTPSTNSFYLDYAFVFHFSGGNHLEIIENGVTINNNVGGYTSSTVAKITYDGENVNYYVDDVLVRSVARPIGAALHFDSSFYYGNNNGTLKNVKFGPLSFQTPGIGIPSNVPTSSLGKRGDIPGMFAADSNYLYYCTQRFYETSYSSTIAVGYSGTFPSIVKGSIPQPLAGWVLVHNGNSYILDSNATEGNPGEWTLSLSSSISVTAGDAVTIGPASAANIWKRVGWNNDTW